MITPTTAIPDAAAASAPAMRDSPFLKGCQPPWICTYMVEQMRKRRRLQRQGGRAHHRMPAPAAGRASPTGDRICARPAAFFGTDCQYCGFAKGIRYATTRLSTPRLLTHWDGVCEAAAYGTAACMSYPA